MIITAHQIWVLFALLAAVTSAAMVLVNDRFKVDELPLLFNMRAIALIVSFAVAIFVPAPTDLIFYLYVVLGALCAALLDQILVRLASTVGAGVVSRIDPLSVALTFVMWLIITPSLALDYLNDLLRLTGILASMAAALYFSLRLRKCSVSSGALQAMIPAIFASALTITLGKLAMNHAEHIEGVVWYVVVQCAVTAAFYGVRLYRRGLRSSMDIKQVILDKRVVIASLCIASAWLIHVPSKYYAIAMVENPSYVTILNLTAPLWVMLFYRIKKHKEIADVKSGLGIVASAIFFIIFTQM